MNSKNKKKVLIVGASAKEYALAKKFLSYEENYEVFVVPGNSMIAEFCKCEDIREDKPEQILKFAIDNSIDLTVVSSQKAIRADIVSYFQINGQLIFAPSFAASDFALSKAVCKKFLYKMHIPAVHFGIFDKEQAAYEYLKTSDMPVVIRSDEDCICPDRLVCTTFENAKAFAGDLFARNEKKVITEDFVYGHEFTFYVITDGYSVLPLISAADYKFSENGDGGILTDGLGTYAPDYKITAENEAYLMKNVVLPIISAKEKSGHPYQGILGVNCVLKDDGNIVVLDFRTFFADYDCQAILNLLDDNIYLLFEACAIGSFADDYENIKFTDKSSISCILSSRKSGSVISGLDFAEKDDISFFNLSKNEYMEYLTVRGYNMVITKTANTLSRARNNLYEDIELINFDGKKFRNDICPPVL